MTHAKVSSRWASAPRAPLTLAPSYGDDAGKHVKPYFGGRPAIGIASDLIVKFIEKRRAAGASNAEINRELPKLTADRAEHAAVHGLGTVTVLRDPVDSMAART